MNLQIAKIVFGTAALSLTCQAGLIKGDFLTPGDGQLITDTSTHLQWLAPKYTAGETWNDAAIQNLETGYGFRYASYAEAKSMIDNNFNNPPEISYVNGQAVGLTAAGYSDAQSFFNIFGINENVYCEGTIPPGPCPRTQGLTADGAAISGYDSNDDPIYSSHYAISIIEQSNLGGLFGHNAWPDSFADGQMGSFLVRTEGQTGVAPEPGSAGLLVIGSAVFGLLSRTGRFRWSLSKADTNPKLD